MRQNGKWICQVLGILVILTLTASSSFATLSFSLSTAEMTKDADEIVVGQVTNIESTWEDGGKKIYSYVEVEVSESLKGVEAQKVLIRQLGGEVGEIGQRVEGLSTFDSGEEILVFLKENSAGELEVVGMSQGKYQVLTDRASGTRTVQRDTHGLCFVQKDGSILRSHQASQSDEVNLEDLIKTIKENID